MNTRTQKVIRILMQEKADALLVWNSEGSGQPATEWLSGFTGSSSVVVMVQTTPSSILPLGKGERKKKETEGIRTYLITDGRYTAQAKKEVKGFSVIISSVQKPTLKILGEIIKKNKLRTILFDGSVTAHSVVEEIKSSVASEGDTSFYKGGIKRLPVELISRKHILQELRVVKEEGEMQLLKKAAEIARRAFTRLLPKLRAGMTEKDIAKRLEDLMAEEGAEGVAFPTIVASGKNGAHPHARASDKKIQKGELVTIDFGARYKGYVSDMTRTIAIGRVSLRLKKVYEVVRKAQELGCKKAKAGMTGQELDSLCRDSIAKSGFGKYFTHSTGHGIGMEVHELPHVSPAPLPATDGGTPLARGDRGHKRRGRNTNVLSAGAVITCEPGVYIPNVGGVRIEDALVLTKKGNINLSADISRELLTF